MSGILEQIDSRLARLEQRIEQLLLAQAPPDVEDDDHLRRRQVALKAPADALLTREEARALLEVSRSTFYRMIRDGEIPDGTVVGGKKKWCKADLLDRAAAS